MKTTAASANPMIDGIEETPTTRSPSGIQNQTRPMAAPVIIDAEGTRPMRRCGLSVSSVIGGATIGSVGVVTATMHSTYGVVGPRNTAIAGELCGGYPPVLFCGRRRDEFSAPARSARVREHRLTQEEAP
jgi:hypothetical protein